MRGVANAKGSITAVYTSIYPYILHYVDDDDVDGGGGGFVAVVLMVVGSK